MQGQRVCCWSCIYQERKKGEERRERASGYLTLLSSSCSPLLLEILQSTKQPLPLIWSVWFTGWPWQVFWGRATCVLQRQDTETAHTPTAVVWVRGKNCGTKVSMKFILTDPCTGVLCFTSLLEMEPNSWNAPNQNGKSKIISNVQVSEKGYKLQFLNLLFHVLYFPSE